MKNRYQTPMPSSWWLHRPAFRRFMARELTCIFVLGYVIYLLVWLWQLGEGPKEYAAMIECARSPLSVTLHLVALAGVLYHAITWFQLTPQIMPVVSKLAKDPWSFRARYHFSTGNNTGESMFGIFSGLTPLHLVKARNNGIYPLCNRFW